MLCLFIATNCSKLAMDADDARSSASGTSDVDDVARTLWTMMSDLSSVIQRQNAKITALTTEVATLGKKVTTLSADVNALKTGYKDPPIIRVVSWNVADNKYMDGELPYKMMPKDAIEKLLGLSNDDNDNDKVADIFAVGLQEQCWSCNFDDMLDIPKEFMKKLSDVGEFEIVGIKGTRESDSCESGCKKEKSDHGTTALFVIARRGLVIHQSSSSFTTGCSTRNNNEKGLAYMKMVLKTGQSVCVATNHLESREPKWRRDCLKGFFADAAKTLAACDFHFISGDFNTRTAEKENGKTYPFDESDIPSLKTADEMVGSQPWSSDEEWAGNLLTYINDIQETRYRESPFNFLPTYKLETKDRTVCGDKRPCYRTNRPHSWVDRILHSGGTSLEYNSIHLELSDHHPVYEVFQLSSYSSGGSCESTPEDSEMDGSRRWADGTDGIPVNPCGLRSEFKMQQDEIIKLRRLIGCYHGIEKPVVYSGTAGASSTWSSNYAPLNAFENSVDLWVSGKLGDGLRRPKLYFNFTSEVTVAMIGLTTGTAWGQAPKSFELIASMDCGNWHVLRSVVDHIWPDGNQEFIWTIPCDLIKPWKCYGIRATAHSGSRHDCVSVKEMKMFTIQGWQKRPDIRPDATEGGKEDQANS